MAINITAATQQAAALGDVNFPAATGAATMAVWWKHPGTAQYGVWAINKSSGANLNSTWWGLGVDGTNVVGRLYTTGNRVEASGGTLTSGAWHHLAWRYTGAALQAYINGVAAGASVALTGTIITATQAAFIFGRAAAVNAMGGTYADIRVYTRAISLNELETLYNVPGANCVTAGLLWHWRLREGAPGVTVTGAGAIRDYSDLKVNATPANNPTWAEDWFSTGQRNSALVA